MLAILNPTPVAAKPAVTIRVQRGAGDCEDCGWYDHASATVRVGERTLEAGYDGHLGGGNWDGDNETLHLWALNALGVRVLVDGEPPARPYMERGKFHWEDIDLCPTPAEIIDIRVETAPDPEYPEYPTEVAASWVGAAGKTNRVEVGKDWDGHVNSLYARLLHERAKVHMKERRARR